MSKRFYGRINTAPELEKLQAEADKSKRVAVGITKGGGLYILENGKATKVAEDNAAEYLDTSVDEIRKLVNTKGEYEIPSKKEDASDGLEDTLPEPKPTEAPTLEALEELEPVIEEIQTEEDPAVEDELHDESLEPEIEEEVELQEAPEYIQRLEYQVKDLVEKIDALPGEHEGLLKEVKGLRSDLGRFISKLDKILLD